MDWTPYRFNSKAQNGQNTSQTKSKLTSGVHRVCWMQWMVMGWGLRWTLPWPSHTACTSVYTTCANELAHFESRCLYLIPAIDVLKVIITGWNTLPFWNICQVLTLSNPFKPPGFFSSHTKKNQPLNSKHWFDSVQQAIGLMCPMFPSRSCSS